MKTLSEKSTAKFSWGRYILIVGAALILAIGLYTLLNVSDAIDGPDADFVSVTDPTNRSMTGTQPASFQQISEFREGGLRKLRIAGKAEPGAVVVITNRGERIRQIAVNDLGQWGLTLDVEDAPMALEAQLYIGEGASGIRSEETVFRLAIPEEKTAEEDSSESDAPAPIYKTSALIMVTAPGSPSRIIQSPFGGAPSSGPLTLSVIDYDSSGGIIITGTSSIPGRVRFYAQNAVIGETGIGVGGRWNFIAGRMMPRANINITAELIPAQGAPNVPEGPISITVPFNFLTPLQEQDTDGSGALSVNIDPQQWQVRRTLIGGGGQSTVVFAPQAETQTPAG